MEELDRVLEFRRNLNRLSQSPVKAGDYVSPLEGEVMKVKNLDNTLPEAKTIIKGATDKIDTKGVQKLLSGNQFSNKIAKILESRALAKAGNVAKQGLNIASEAGKRIPMLGGLAVGLGTALATRDASAAVPGLNEADVVGPVEGSIEHKLESGQPLTDEERLALSRR